MTSEGRDRPAKKKQFRNASKKGGKPSPEDSEAIKRAIGRFEMNPLPTGLPESIDPPPRKIEIDWPIKLVSKAVQDRVSEIVTRKGEFGYLPQKIPKILGVLFHLLSPVIAAIYSLSRIAFF